MNRASGAPASRAAARLIGATVPPMATEAEKLGEELLQLVAPLETDALTWVIAAVRGMVTHEDGAELAAKRTAEALAAEAFIRS